MSRNQRPQAQIVGYAQIAELMGVKTTSVRIYAVKDPDFPAPVTPPELRSPGFDRDEISAYIELRNNRRKGRPPRTVDNEPRIKAGPELGQHIRSLIEATDGAVTTASLAQLLGISHQMLWFRLRGQVRWKASELDAVARALGTTTDALLVGVDSNQA